MLDGDARMDIDVGIHREFKCDDSDRTALLPSPSHVVDFEFLECKAEPCIVGSTEDPFVPETSLTLHDPVPPVVSMVKNPVILLERCDKIWETLQLIKLEQNKYPTTASDDCDDCDDDKEEKEASLSNKVERVSSRIKKQSELKDSGSASLPFQFSVQRTKKLFPCLTCGKQYMENRSLRRHSEREHGIIIPLLRKYNKPKLTGRNNHNGSSLVSSLRRRDCSEGVRNNANSCKKTIAEFETAKLPTSSLKRCTSVMQDVNLTDDRVKTEGIRMSANSVKQLARCALCRQKVVSVKKHLINYHKIGCSSSMMKQLESTLSIDSETSLEVSQTTLFDKSEARVDESARDEIHTNERGKVNNVSRVRKRKYTLSYVNVMKRLKLNMERSSIQSSSLASIQKQNATVTMNDAFKCDICLGLYASANSFAKHKRIHRLRGETKENFHKFKCRYFNSPLNVKNQSSGSSSQSAVAKSAGDSASEDLRSVDEHQVSLNRGGKASHRIERASVYNRKTSRSADTICLCGRAFRNPYTLFVHKNKCKLCGQEDKMAERIIRDEHEYSSDRDSGIGINITIKKRNNSYEIVGKDKDEEEPKKPDHSRSDTWSSDATDRIVADSADARIDLQQDAIESSEYSKDHSVLKLQVADEDVIIDVEDDTQFLSGDRINAEVKQMDTVVRKDDKSHSCADRRNNDATKAARDGKAREVRTLKRMCEEVLDELAEKRKPEDAATFLLEDNRRNLRSSCKSHRNAKEERQVRSVASLEKPFSVCGYCYQEFDTIDSYKEHRCTVEEGKQFAKFSLNLQCSCCNEVLNNCNQFDDHMRIKHFDCGYYCYLCPKRFASETMRTCHSRKEHDTSCRFCKKKISISTIAKHEAYHLGFGHPCHLCKKAYSLRKYLLYHNTIHKNGADNSVICNLCLKPIKLKTFRYHMRSHSRNECHFCGKVFTNRTGLEYHTLTYHCSAQSRIRCNARGIRFLTREQLDSHKRADGSCSKQKMRKRVVAV